MSTTQTETTTAMRIVCDWPDSWYIIPEAKLTEWYQLRSMPYPEMAGGKYPDWVTPVPDLQKLRIGASWVKQ